MIRVALIKRFGIGHEFTENEVIELLNDVYVNAHNNFTEAVLGREVKQSK